MNIGIIGSIDFERHYGGRTRSTRIYTLLTECYNTTFLNLHKSSLPQDISGHALTSEPQWIPHTGRQLVGSYHAVTIAEQYDFDLVWAYNSVQLTPLVGYTVARRLDAPLIVGINDHRHGNGLKDRFINEYIRSYILKRANILVLESETLQRNLDTYGIRPRRSVVVPTGIDINEYYVPDEPLAEDPVIFYVGRDKDIDLLLNAAVMVHDRLPNVRIRIAGVESNAYPGYSDKEYIEFLGSVSEKALCREMGRAHVCTVPYRDADTAGRPVKLLEYMSAAKCIVATDLPFNTQMLTDGENAIIVDAIPDSFAKGLLRALDNPAQRDYLAQQAREDVRAYSLEQMGEKLRQVVELASKQ